MLVTVCGKAGALGDSVTVSREKNKRGLSCFPSSWHVEDFASLKYDYIAINLLKEEQSHPNSSSSTPLVSCRFWWMAILCLLTP
ncbi:hypothetical protein HN51_054858 [Arachis hypogaea]